MHYVTVFDASSFTGFFRDWGLVALLGVPLVLIWREFLGKRKPRADLSGAARSFYRFLLWLATLAITIGFLVAALGVIGAAFLSRQALISGQCRVVEGRVSHFRPQPRDKIPEHFEVAGHGYDYIQRQLWGFRQISAEGGPIREGLALRLCDHDGAILKLEIAR